MASSTPSVPPALLSFAQSFVIENLQGNDSSHDYAHIQRVRQMASRLAKEEGLSQAQCELVDLCALLHDVHDWKYSREVGKAAASIQAFMDAQQAPNDLTQAVLSIVASVGFKDELRSNGGEPSCRGSLSPEAAVVQDADRLDAVGAVGIARCLTFGGRFNRVLHDPGCPPRGDNMTKEEYMASGQKTTTINHFHEKLLKLRGMLKTKAGRAVGEQRHAFMEQFLAQFYAECEGRA